MVLNSAITVTLGAESLEIGRTGTGVSMKIQAKDCAQGGVFQMEPQRSSGALTTIVHTLATSTVAGLTPFYFDNPFFRARIGQFLGADCTSVVTGPPSKFCVQVTARTNIANDLSPKFVLRDSTQVATQDCPRPGARQRLPSPAEAGWVTSPAKTPSRWPTPRQLAHTSARHRTRCGAGWSSSDSRSRCRQRSRIP